MKYKIGDRVKVVGNITKHRFKVGEVVDIVEVDDSVMPYRARVKDEFYWVNESDIAPLEKTLDNLEVGDVVTDKIGEITVLGVCGKVYLMSYINEEEKCLGGYTAQELKDLGYTIKSSSPVIEINGKKYNKAKVDERLKELEEIK